MTTFSANAMVGTPLTRTLYSPGLRVLGPKLQTLPVMSVTAPPLAGVMVVPVHDAGRALGAALNCVKLDPLGTHHWLKAFN